MRPKSIPESLEIDFGRPRGRSMSTSTAFGWCFEECYFLMVFEVCKTKNTDAHVKQTRGQKKFRKFINVRNEYFKNELIFRLNLYFIFLL